MGTVKQELENERYLLSQPLLETVTSAIPQAIRQRVYSSVTGDPITLTKHLSIYSFTH